MKFLVPGHTFLPNDSDFSDIECALKHQQRLYVPEDYMNTMEQCRTKIKFTFVKMNTENFMSKNL